MEEIWKGLSGGKLLTVNAGMSANKLLSTSVKYSMHVSGSAQSNKQEVEGGRRSFTFMPVFSHLIMHVFPSVCKCAYARVSVSKRMEIFLHLKNNFQEQLLGTSFNSKQAEGETKVVRG